MNTDALFESGQALVREHWEALLILPGLVLVLGAARDWNWLCDPAGARSAHSTLGRRGRRGVLGLLGALLVALGLWLLLC